MSGYPVVPIGWVESPLKDRSQAPRQGDEGAPDDPARPPVGVFSTRSPDRPNPIGLHRVHVVAAGGLRILVRPLEALDQTPVIDVKPVLRGTGER